MALNLYNSLGGKIEEFTPAVGNTVRFYACGPTVYDYGHIGNFRTFVAVDVLRRFLRQSGFELMHVMNITDVDDKIIRNANQRGMPIGEYTKKYEQAFLEDMNTLGIEQPEQISRARPTSACIASTSDSTLSKRRSPRSRSRNESLSSVP